METISCIIADDEPAARTLLRGYINNLTYLTCKADFSSALDAFHFIQEHRVSLIFLDIQMPQLNGIELARMLSSQQAIIFTTAHSDFALQGFETGAIDYLLKPVSFERFLRAVNKALRYLGAEVPKEANHENPGSFSVKVNGQIQAIQSREIIYIQSFGNFLKIFHNKKMTLATDTIKHAEQQLQAHGFVRCHRSYLVNKIYVAQVRSDSLVLSNTTHLPIGYLYKREVEQSLKDR